MVLARFCLLLPRGKSRRGVKIAHDPIEGSCTIKFYAATRCGRVESRGRIGPGLKGRRICQFSAKGAGNFPANMVEYCQFIYNTI